MRRLLAAAALLAVVLLTAAPAGADELTVRRLDTTQAPEMRMTVQAVGRVPDLRSFQVRENGRLVPSVRVVPLEQSTTLAVGVVLVIDTSGSMADAGKMEAAKRAAVEFLRSKATRTRVAIVAFSERPRVVTNFTDDLGLLESGVAALQPSGETALWDGVTVAAGLFESVPDVVPALVVLSDGADTVSRATAEQALGAARAAEAPVYAVTLTGGGESDAPALERLAQATGGTFAATGDADRLGDLYGRVQQAIANQYELRWETALTEGAVDVQVTAGGLAVRASTTLGSRSDGSATTPEVVAAERSNGILDGGVGRALVALFVFLAATALVLGLVALVARDRASLDSALLPYVGGAVAPREAETGARSFADSAIVRRAVAATASLAGERGVLDRVEARLDQADLKLRAAEAVFFVAALGLLLSIAALAFDPMLGLLVVIFVVLAPPALLNMRVGQRRKAFTSLLPDTLNMLASSLRAGYSLPQAVTTVAREAEEPMARELGRVVAEAQLGRPMEEALEDTARRMGSPDFDWAVMAIRIQREVGGNLAELLTTVADTMVARERLRREVSSLTAEGKVSATFLVALPFVIGAFMYVRNPGYIDVLFTNPTGKILLVGSAVLLVGGFVWMRKIIAIDI